MKRLLYSLLGCSLLLFVIGCSSGKESITVAKFDGAKISLAEFEKAYTKNNGNVQKAVTDSMDQYKRFLDLYTIFKMKLSDAKARGYENDQAMMNELTDYRKSIGTTYILEKQLVDPNVYRLWELRKNEYRIAHIMIRPDTSGEINARAKAEAILDSVLHKGKTFEEMVTNYSEDSYSKRDAGDIYYVTPGLLPPEFEEGYLMTPLHGICPKVVKTRFGFHIIRVNEIRPRIPQVRASHIMISFTKDDGTMDTSAAKLRIDSVAQMLAAGADFAETAKKYSDDGSTKDNGGDLGFFERRMMVKEFDEAAFNLKPGEMSKIIRTVYGYHIIKVTEHKSSTTYDEEKENLKLSYRQNRYNADYDTLVAGLQKKFGYSFNQQSFTEFTKAADTTVITTDLTKAPWYDLAKGKVLFSFAPARNFTVDSLCGYLLRTPEYTGKAITDALMNEAVKKYSGDLALEIAALNLDKENADFAGLMDDYKNGIFIFKLSDDEIWGKIAVDSLKLLEHYEKTKDKYRWNDRVEFTEIFVRADSMITVIKEKLAKGISFDTLAAQFTERPGFKEKAGRFALMDATGSDLAVEANKLEKPGDISPSFASSGGFALIQLVKKEPARIKTFEEAKPEVSGSFQDEESKRLENNYIDRLKTTYHPEYFYEKLQGAFKTL